MSQKVLVVGLGNMGGSLVAGLLKSDWGRGLDISIFDSHRSRYEKYLQMGKVAPLESLQGVDLKNTAVVICVKPQDLPLVAKEFGPGIRNASVVLSVLAGAPIKLVGETLGYAGPVIRSMPNIAATVGCAATALSANERCTEELRSFAERLFNSVGESYWTKESLMDVVTGLSGSGPAYIYMVIEALTDGGVNMGMPRDLALKLATQTVLGAAKLVKESGTHPAVLKDQVTTPAGTTISALVELESHGLRSMFVSAVVAATERSRDLGKGSD